MCTSLNCIGWRVKSRSIRRRAVASIAKKFVKFLRNACTNTPKNASALYTSTDAVQGGTHIKNPKPSKECTYGVKKSDRTHTYRNVYIAVWVV